MSFAIKQVKAIMGLGKTPEKSLINEQLTLSIFITANITTTPLSK
jgi:hypothetical protein